METIKVSGMSCQHCVNAVTKAIKEVDNVSEVTVNLDKGEASYETSGPVDKEKVKEAVRKAGYSAE